MKKCSGAEYAEMLVKVGLTERIGQIDERLESLDAERRNLTLQIQMCAKMRERTEEVVATQVACLERKRMVRRETMQLKAERLALVRKAKGMKFGPRRGNWRSLTG